MSKETKQRENKRRATFRRIHVRDILLLFSSFNKPLLCSRIVSVDMEPRPSSIKCSPYERLLLYIVRCAVTVSTSVRFKRKLITLSSYGVMFHEYVKHRVPLFEPGIDICPSEDIVFPI